MGVAERRVAIELRIGYVPAGSLTAIGVVVGSAGPSGS